MRCGRARVRWAVREDSRRGGQAERTSAGNSRTGGTWDSRAGELGRKKCGCGRGRRGGSKVGVDLPGLCGTWGLGNARFRSHPHCWGSRRHSQVEQRAPWSHGLCREMRERWGQGQGQGCKGGGSCCHLLSPEGGDTGTQRFHPSMGQSLILHVAVRQPAPHTHTYLAHSHVPPVVTQAHSSPWVHTLSLTPAPSLTHALMHAHALHPPPRTSLVWAGLRGPADAAHWPGVRRAISETAAPQSPVCPQGSSSQTQRTSPLPQRWG